jgi:histidinol dehydrogenase
LIQYSPAALKKVSRAINVLAEAEGLPSHADSVRLRTEKEGKDKF